MRRVLILIILWGMPFASPLYPAAEDGKACTVHFARVPQSGLNGIQAAGGQSDSVRYTVSDISYGKQYESGVLDMSLSFDGEPVTLHHDDTSRYQVLSAEYSFTKAKGAHGSGCALFYRDDHEVVLKPEASLWLGNSGDLGSFTVEFRINPSTIRDGAVIFSRLGSLNGSIQGIEIKLHRGRVFSGFYGIFEDKSGFKKNVEHHGVTSIHADKWYHYVLSFDRSDGRLSSYLDGKEQETQYLTADGTPDTAPYTPRFGVVSDQAVINRDFPPAIIGRGFCGLIDELKISLQPLAVSAERYQIKTTAFAPRKLNGREPKNAGGTVTSPVYSFNDFGTRVVSFDWDEKLPDGTFIWMEFRTSDSLFAEKDNQPRWYRISNSQKEIFKTVGEDKKPLRGRYYQWRANLAVSPDGKSAPELSNIRLKYQPDLPPGAPMFFEVVSAGDENVLLRWKKNTDYDIGGYRLYYSTSTDRYEGIITFANGKKIDNTYQKGDYIYLSLDNRVIEENLRADSRGLLAYPLLRNTVLYYFAVSAYDTYRPGTPYNHESKLSDRKSARPYAGTEIISENSAKAP